MLNMLIDGIVIVYRWGSMSHDFIAASKKLAGLVGPICVKCLPTAYIILLPCVLPSTIVADATLKTYKKVCLFGLWG